MFVVCFQSVTSILPRTYQCHQKRRIIIPGLQLQSRLPMWSLDTVSTYATVQCCQRQALFLTYLDLSHLTTRMNQYNPAPSAPEMSATNKTGGADKRTIEGNAFLAMDQFPNLCLHANTIMYFCFHCLEVSCGYIK